MSAPFEHRSVLLSEAIALLAPRPGGVVVDCTLGGGGHAEAILEASGPDGRLIGLDRDPAALEAAGARLVRFGSRFTGVHGAFGDIVAHLARLGLGRVGGVLADLGVSSPQLDQAERGFSFSKDGPLDMRMDPTRGSSAAEVVNRASEAELADILWRLGEERHSRRVARAIVAGRPFTSTAQLAGVVARAVGRAGDIHPATRTFQALRLAVNDELGELERLLVALPSVLIPGGRAVIISFHSLEDRRVKQCFREYCGVGGERDAYGRPLDAPRATLLTSRAIQASDDNPRARSARLRVIQWL